MAKKRNDHPFTKKDEAVPCIKCNVSNLREKMQVYKTKKEYVEGVGTIFRTRYICARCCEPRGESQNFKKKKKRGQNERRP